MDIQKKKQKKYIRNESADYLLFIQPGKIQKNDYVDVLIIIFLKND